MNFSSADGSFEKNRSQIGCQEAERNAYDARILEREQRGRLNHSTRRFRDLRPVDAHETRAHQNEPDR